MADIKPAEVSAILREQLSGFRSEAELQEVFRLNFYPIEQNETRIG